MVNFVGLVLAVVVFALVGLYYVLNARQLSDVFVQSALKMPRFFAVPVCHPLVSERIICLGHARRWISRACGKSRPFRPADCISYPHCDANHLTNR